MSEDSREEERRYEEAGLDEGKTPTRVCSEIRCPC